MSPVVDLYTFENIQRLFDISNTKKVTSDIHYDLKTESYLKVTSNETIFSEHVNTVCDVDFSPDLTFWQQLLIDWFLILLEYVISRLTNILTAVIDWIDCWYFKSM